MTDFLWYGLNALIIATITLLGYEWHAFRHRDPDEPMISWIVQRWVGHHLWRKMAVLVPCFIIGFAIQFLGVHFAFSIP